MSLLEARSKALKNAAVASTLRRIPPEILGLIFEWTLLTKDRRKELLRPHASPWVLTRVSSLWRAVSISTPRLWSLVYIHAASYIPPLSMVQAQVARAGTLQIQFHGCENEDVDRQTELFDLLCEHSTRWEELALISIASFVSRMDALRGRLPALKQLWLQWAEAASHQGVDSIDCFETCHCEKRSTRISH
ncbi:hypothetical protein FB45DRAFT_1028446 [Roridomyces roridus]|uniref:F-box domain-containing protein n=1 Tax=Roridomyces roridus TaxID=1738132 RepID=A0AAD7BRS8_9AGAR|nr:hypothetical protein FB45DRAFT_1028446 [Roridomyces roridus]